MVRVLNNRWKIRLKRLRITHVSPVLYKLNKLRWYIAMLFGVNVIAIQPATRALICTLKLESKRFLNKNYIITKALHTSFILRFIVIFHPIFNTCYVLSVLLVVIHVVALAKAFKFNQMNRS